jgi:hypothetical protein
MRLFGRILGVGFALSGIAILGMFLYALVSEGWRRGDWKEDGVFIAIGLGLILAGRYYWRTDSEAPDGPQPTSNFTRFLANHRYQLKVLSQTGAALSVLGIIAACLGWDWSARWTWLPLVLGAFILDSFAKKVANPEVTDNRDWMRVPESIRRTLSTMPNALAVAQVCVVGISLVSMWTRYSLVDTRGYHVGVRIFAYGLTAFMYALQALFFQYGDLRDENDLTAT